jgi:hypothetical protein
LQICVASLISPIFGVLTFIRFDDEHLFERHEVNDPGADGDLPTKFCTCELPGTKKLPKLGFSVRRCATKVTRTASFEFADSIFRHFPLTRLALATLSQQNSDLSEFCHLLSGRSRKHPTSTGRG